MLLVIDIGNTHIVVGVFDGDAIQFELRLHTDERATGDELGLLVTDLLQRHGVKTSMITAIAVSNVVPDLAQAVNHLGETYFGITPLVVGPGVKTGIRINYDDPRQVGADRIANALAAQRIYGGPAIMVDFGTATTIDAIDENGDYLGGAIAPGVMVSLDALVARAAKLSRVELSPPPSVIGHTTTTSMQSGFVFGWIGLIEGLVARIKAEIGDAKVIATGGLASTMVPYIPSVTVTDEHLTLVGLRLLHELNRQEKPQTLAG